MEAWRARSMQEGNEPIALGNPSRRLKAQNRARHLEEDDFYTQPSLGSRSKLPPTQSARVPKGNEEKAEKIRNPISHSFSKLESNNQSSKVSTRKKAAPSSVDDDENSDEADPMDLLSSSQCSDNEYSAKKRNKPIRQRKARPFENNEEEATPKKPSTKGKKAVKSYKGETETNSEVVDLTSDDAEVSARFPIPLTPRKTTRPKPSAVKSIPMDLTPQGNRNPSSPPSVFPITLTPTKSPPDNDVDQSPPPQRADPAPFPMQLTQGGFHLKRRAKSPSEAESMDVCSEDDEIQGKSPSSRSFSYSPPRSREEEVSDERNHIKKRQKSATSEPSTIDYATLCAFCDEVLPQNPSRSLQRLFEQIKVRARKQPRPTNPLGLTAPFTVYVQYCHDHRAETSYIPYGLTRGWPKKIDFSRILPRLQKSKNLKMLQMIANGDGKADTWGEDGRGHFWDIAKHDVQSRGLRVANSVQGQMETFEITQPGYYGEQGQMAISVALDSLFPPASISPESIIPLLPSDFRRRVLLPEAALLLIQEDMGVGRNEAMDIMAESRHFGLAMFPVRDGEEDISITLDRPPKRDAETSDTSKIFADQRISEDVTLVDVDDRHDTLPQREALSKKKKKPRVFETKSIPGLEKALQSSMDLEPTAPGSKSKKAKYDWLLNDDDEEEEFLPSGVADSSKVIITKLPSASRWHSRPITPKSSSDLKPKHSVVSNGLARKEAEQRAIKTKSSKVISFNKPDSLGIEGNHYPPVTDVPRSMIKTKTTKSVNIMPSPKKSKKLKTSGHRSNSKIHPSFTGDDPFESDDSDDVAKALRAAQQNIGVLNSSKALGDQKQIQRLPSLGQLARGRDESPTGESEEVVGSSSKKAAFSGISPPAQRIKTSKTKLAKRESLASLVEARRKKREKEISY